MAEYIEREALRAKAVYMHGFGENKYVPLKAIENAPAADVVPVKHGRWIDRGWDGDFSWRIDGRGTCWRVYQCSCCKDEQHGSPKYNFCPNCGAKMDLEG